MRERAMKLAIAVVLTVVDFVTFNSYSGAIWQTWGQDLWAKAALVALLTLWIVSAVVLWIHASYDLPQPLHERDLALARDPTLAPRGFRRDSDV
jgi:uncharacterized membrane protein YdbT with pleckstrin-like domain